MNRLLLPTTQLVWCSIFVALESFFQALSTTVWGTTRTTTVCVALISWRSSNSVRHILLTRWTERCSLTSQGFVNQVSIMSSTRSRPRKGVTSSFLKMCSSQAEGTRWQKSWCMRRAGWSEIITIRCVRNVTDFTQCVGRDLLCGDVSHQRTATRRCRYMFRGCCQRKVLGLCLIFATFGYFFHDVL